MNIFKGHLHPENIPHVGTEAGKQQGSATAPCCSRGVRCGGWPLPPAPPSRRLNRAAILPGGLRSPARLAGAQASPPVVPGGPCAAPAPAPAAKYSHGRAGGTGQGAQGRWQPAHRRAPPSPPACAHPTQGGHGHLPAVNACEDACANAAACVLRVCGGGACSTARSAQWCLHHTRARCGVCSAGQVLGGLVRATPFCTAVSARRRGVSGGILSNVFSTEGHTQGVWGVQRVLHISAGAGGAGACSALCFAQRRVHRGPGGCSAICLAVVHTEGGLGCAVE